MDTVLSTKQKNFLEMITELSNSSGSHFQCAYPSIVRTVIADNEYDTIQRVALNRVRKDYIKYLEMA